MLLTASLAFKSYAASVPLLHGLTAVAGWRMGFWVCGLAGIVWIAFFYPWFRDNPADKPSVNQAELDLINAGKHPRPHAVRDPRVWAALFTSRSMWGLALLYVFGSFGFSFFVTYVPNYLSHKLNTDLKSSQWISAAPLLCGGVTCLIGGILSDKIVRRLGRKRLARAIFPIVGHFIAAAAVLGLRYVTTPTQAVVLLSVTMGAYDFGLGAKWAAIVDVGGRHSGLAAGFVNMVGNLGGNCLQPIMAPWIISRFGWPTLLAVYAVMYILGAASWFLIHPDKHFYPEDQDEAEYSGPRGFEVQAPSPSR
jgi:ACS family glucarate transporter-like MFS transporter